MQELIFLLFCTLTLFSAESRPLADSHVAGDDFSDRHVANRHLLDNSLDQILPLGWNGWNFYGCGVTEGIVKRNADELVKLKLKDLGYQYVVVDDCWMQAERDAQGRLQANSTLYPSGMAALADYIHSRGLKFGLYLSSGTTTCKGLPGSLGHEEIDAQTLFDFGVDFLKYDSCGSKQNISDPERFVRMQNALNKVDRPIYYSMNSYGQGATPQWAGPIANAWRTNEDLNPTWASIVSAADWNDRFHNDQGPYWGWNDLDMLQVGNGNLSVAEWRSHFSLWAIAKSPLFIGTELMSLSPQVQEILSNSEIIDINQDALGVQATKVIGPQGTQPSADPSLEVWAGPLSNNRVIVMLWNRSPQTAQLSVAWNQIGIPDGTNVTIREVWKHAFYPAPIKNRLGPVTLASHDCAVYWLGLLPNATSGVTPPPIADDIPRIDLNVTGPEDPCNATTRNGVKTLSYVANCTNTTPIPNPNPNPNPTTDPRFISPSGTASASPTSASVGNMEKLVCGYLFTLAGLALVAGMLV